MQARSTSTRDTLSMSSTHSLRAIDVASAGSGTIEAVTLGSNSGDSVTCPSRSPSSVSLAQTGPLMSQTEATEISSRHQSTLGTPSSSLTMSSRSESVANEAATTTISSSLNHEGSKSQSSKPFVPALDSDNFLRFVQMRCCDRYARQR